MVDPAAEAALRTRFHALVATCTQETLAYALAQPAKAVAGAVARNRALFEAVMA
jgi:hypothetical protein